MMGNRRDDIRFRTESLYGLKQLRYLALDENLVKDPRKIANLQKALPDCKIARLEGVCMGSGWILFLLPVLVAAILMDIRRKRRLNPGPGT